MIGSIATALGSASTLGGLVYLAAEVRSARRIAEADFIFRTQSEFLDGYRDTYSRFLPGGAWAASGLAELSPEEVAELQLYFDFFATLQTLRARGLLSLRTIDEMFAYRFFIVAHSSRGAELIARDRDYWRELRNLYHDWTKYRVLSEGARFRKPILALHLSGPARRGDIFTTGAMLIRA
jgi:hypothetical protein